MMIRTPQRAGVKEAARRRQRFCPHLEVLENRCNPSTYGNPWPDAEHLTLSFAPDGTQVGNQTSVLFQLMDSRMSRATWQTAIVRAFQTWAVNAKINVSVVADNGAPFGTTGAIQGDDRFGDVRIAAYDLGPDDVAIATPFDVSAGTWAGDLKFNSRFLFGSGGTGGGYDVFTVALHEAGHVFGLPDSADPTSVMYEGYVGARTAPSSNDVAQLLTLYNPRTPDAYEGSTGNGSLAQAAKLNLSVNADGTIDTRAAADITAASDKDYFVFNTGLQLTNTQVTLQTSGVSSLVSRLTLYNGSGTVVASAAATDPFKGDLTLNVSGLKLLTNYYLKVESNRSDVFGVGSYNLRIQTLPSALNGLTSSLVGTISSVTTPLLNNDLHTNDTFLTAALLPQLTRQVDSHFDYAYRASISDSWDVDIYRVVAPQAQAGQPNVMTAMVWGLGSQGLLPALTVYDAGYHPVNAAILVNENGTVVVQVANAVSGATYYVKVAAAQPQGSRNVGNYFLGVDYGTQAVQLRSLAQGTLSQSQPRAAGQLQIYQSQLFHFVLSGQTADATVKAAVRLVIYDLSGKVKFTLLAQNGQTVTGNAYLTKGTYLVRFVAGTADGSTLPAMAYSLQGLNLSDPIGPRSSDPTSDPSQPSSGTTSGSTTTSSTDPSSSDYTYSSTDPTSDPSKTTVQPADPYSDPYSTT